MQVVSIVVPCFNEEAALPQTIAVLAKVIEELKSSGLAADGSKVYFVDDGSRDASWALIVDAAASNQAVAGLKLSRNRGHQSALLAGLLVVPGDVIVSVDADLQDDVSAITKMVALSAEGIDVVYGVRKSRASDTWFKRSTAGAFYRAMSALGVETVPNHADFRLMSRRAVEALRKYDEVNLYLRGLVPLVGFKSATVSYDRSPRVAGESKYPVSKMLALAWEGVTALSVVPLRVVTVVGAMVFLLSMLLSVFVIAVKLFSNAAVPGWASTVLPIYILGGVQILSLGVIGEYVGKIYKESKRRPRFQLEETCGFGTNT